MKAYDGDQPFIFVSYAHADRDIVYPIIEMLQNNGYHVWYDEGLHLGNDWRDELADRIQRCSAFIYMLSEQSVKSGYCKDEIYAADSEMKQRMDGSDSQIEEALQMMTVRLDDSVLTGGMKLILDSRQMVSGIDASSETISSRLIESKMLEECRDQFRYLEGINWGPARAGYYFDELPDHAVFNSMIDSPIYEDERHFLGIDGHTQSIEDHLVNVVPGNTYTVQINFCNNGDPRFNISGGAAIGMKVKVSVKLPEKLEANRLEVLQAEISSTTAEYETVWDQIALCCPSDAIIEYVPASAKIYNYGELSGTGLGTQLFSSGDYIGFNKINGVIPAGMKYSGYITFEFRVLPINEVSLERTVSVDRRSFSDRVSVLPGDVLTFRIKIKNNYHNDIIDVTFRDELPDGLELIPDTTVLYAIPDVEGRKLSDNIVGNGINTGLFGKNINGVIMYKAKVREDISADCELVSKSFLTFNATKRDSADRYTTVPDQVVRKCAQTSCFVKV